MALPVNHPAFSQNISNNFGHSNHGFQAGTITGNVTTEFHSHAPGKLIWLLVIETYRELTADATPEPPEIPSTPLSTILPFDRDPDYVQRASLFEEISVKLSGPAARVALVGLGGVGYVQRPGTRSTTHLSS